MDRTEHASSLPELHDTPSFQLSEKNHINDLFIQQKLWQISIAHFWGINTMYFTDSHVPAKCIPPEVMGILPPGTPGHAGANYWAKMHDSMVLIACHLLRDSSATQFRQGKISGASKGSADLSLLSSFIHVSLAYTKILLEAESKFKVHLKEEPVLPKEEGGLLNLVKILRSSNSWPGAILCLAGRLVSLITAGQHRGSFLENRETCNPASARNKEPCKYNLLDTNWCSTHICPYTAWHLPYGSIPLSPPSSGKWPFPKKSWWLCSCRPALHLQIWRMTFSLCIVLLATKHILFTNSNPRGRIQTYYCGRKQIQHTISITWVRQLISITANGIYASIQQSMVLKICTSFWS